MALPSIICIVELTTKKGATLRQTFYTLMELRQYIYNLEHERTYAQKVNKIVSWQYKVYYPRELS